MVAATLENITEVPLRGKIELPYDPAVLPLRLYAENAGIRKDTWTQACTVAPFTRAKTWKHTKCPWTDGWIEKKWCLYTWSMAQP